MDSRRGWFHIVQDLRMLPVFVVVSMALGIAFGKIYGIPTEACQYSNCGRV